MVITNDGNIPSRFAHSFNVMKMAQGFYDAGEEVTLVTYLSFPNIIARIKILGNIFGFYGVSSKIKIKAIPVWGREFFHNTLGGERYSIKASELIAKLKPNFVFCRSYLTAYYCTLKGLPTIIETHTTEYDNPNLRKIYEIAARENFLGLVTIHESIAKQHNLLGIPKEKILVLEDGVDLKQFEISDNKQDWRRKLNLSKSQNIVMYIGSLAKEKGIADIIEVASSLRENNTIHFYIGGGKNEDIVFWKNYTLGKNLTNITFLGFIINRDVPKYLKAADVLIMPYSTKIDYKIMDIKSTSPLKLFEYMAAKRPIVTSNISTISKIVKNNESALLVEPNDIEGLKNGLETLISDEKLSNELALNAYKNVHKYTWELRSKSIIDKLVNK